MRWACALWILFSIGCSGVELRWIDAGTDSGADSGADAMGPRCDGDAVCDDANTCNGEERCVAGRCESGTPPHDHPPCALPDGGGSGICRTGVCRRGCAADAPFTQVRRISELDAPGYQTLQPFLSSDELTIYFSSNRPNGSGGYDLYAARRESAVGEFGSAEAIPGVNTSGDELRPAISGDARALYFYRGAPARIWVARRSSTDVDFEAPSLVSTPFASPVPDCDVATQYPLPDESALYFASWCEAGDFWQLYRAPVSAPTIGAHAPVMGIDVNTPELEWHPVLTPDELTLYFSTQRNGVTMEHDIYFSTRASPEDGFGQARPVTTAPELPPINTPGFDNPMWISADACELYFQSTGTPSGIFAAEKRP